MSEIFGFGFLLVAYMMSYFMVFRNSKGGIENV